MRKRNLALILCMAAMLCGCGQSKEIRNIDAIIQDIEAEKELPEESENMTEETIEPEPEQQEPERDEQYAIYERFLDGDEPLYFPWRLNGYQEFGDAMIEEGSSYSLDEICNRMNRHDNYKRAVNEMEQLSYAYIDCGADGEAELALLFDDLSYWGSQDDVVSTVLIIKSIDGRLELCGVVDTSGSWGFSNEYGVITQGHTSSMYSEYEVVRFLDADGNNVEIYHKIAEDWGYDTLHEYNYSEVYDTAQAYDSDYTFVNNSYSFEPFDNYPNYEDYLADVKYSFELRDKDSEEKILVEGADPSAKEDKC